MCSLLSRAAFATAPSAFLRRDLQRFRPDIHLVPNALEVSAYPYRHRGRLRPVIVWLRDYHRIYGPLTVPRVVAQVAKVEPAVRAAMYGPDKGDGSLEATRGQVARLGLEGRVEVGRLLDKAEVPTALDQADIFLNTSRVDNAPVSVSEAMACGLCSVSSGAGGIPDLVTDGETGRLVADEPSAYADAIIGLLRDEALCPAAA